MEDSEKSLTYLVSVETLAEEIIADKNALVYLDKKRNENREAARDLKKSGEKKCRIAVGSGFVKCPAEKAIELIEKDQKTIDAEIEKMRSELKVKVNRLRDLEYRPPVPGLMLGPLSKEENAALRGKLY